MSLLLAATMLPVVAIGSDDARLESRWNYVSDAARAAIASPDGEQVYCLDRPERRSICLVKSEWTAAVARANEAPQRGPRAFVPMRDNRAYGGNQQDFGLASSPSISRSR